MKIQKLIKAKKVILEHIEDKITPKLGYKLMKFCKALDAEEEFFDGKMSEIVAIYCKRNDDGTYVKNENGGIEIMDDKLDECHKAIDELNSVEVEKPNFFFTVDELSELKLSISDLLYLEDFIEEEH